MAPSPYWPGELIVKVTDDAVVPYQNRPFAIHPALVNMINNLRFTCGLTRIEPLWQVGVPLFRKLPIRQSPAVPREWVDLANFIRMARPVRNLHIDGIKFPETGVRTRWRLFVDPLKTGEAVERILKASQETGLVEYVERIPKLRFLNDEPSEQPQPPSPGHKDALQYATWGADHVAWKDDWRELPLNNIAVLDTGCDIYHPTFARGDSEPPAVVPMGALAEADPVGHGTFICSLLCGRGARVVDVDFLSQKDEYYWDVAKGLLPNASVSVYRVLSPKYGNFVEPGAYHTALNAVLLSGNIRVVNISFGSDTLGTSGYKTELADMQALEEANIVVVCCSGNVGKTYNLKNGPGKVWTPARYGTSLSVGAMAMDTGDLFWQRSCCDEPPKKFKFGRENGIDVAAPGEYILSALPLTWTTSSQRFSGFKDGTSFAAPFVAAACAVRCSQLANYTSGMIRQDVMGISNEVSEVTAWTDDDDPTDVFKYRALNCSGSTW